VHCADLAGKVAVVTGGARGLGYSMASALAAQGCPVALLDVLPEVDASAARLGQESGVRTSAVRVDVTDRGSVQAAFEQTAAALGTPQVLVTAAGVTVWTDAVDIDADEWRRVMTINLDGTFFAAQAFAAGLLDSDRSGSAILVGSMSGSIVNVPQHQTSYNTSKAAVAHLAKSLAVEWAGHGVRVNSIAPGYFLSQMTRQFTEQNPELAAGWISRIPLGRMGEPEDLHGLVVYLASEASGYLTGQDIVIDGGYTAT
jgi:NAD(P)-dependent dehydrogenase (short-subunit alcohol dehydrogenase family)